jgi:hypothetical protein
MTAEIRHRDENIGLVHHLDEPLNQAACNIRPGFPFRVSRM